MSSIELKYGLIYCIVNSQSPMNQVRVGFSNESPHGVIHVCHED